MQMKYLWVHNTITIHEIELLENRSFFEKHVDISNYLH